MICRINYATPIKPELVRFHLVCFASTDEGDEDINEYEITLNITDLTDVQLQETLTKKIKELMYLDEKCRAWEGQDWRM